MLCGQREVSSGRRRLKMCGCVGARGPAGPPRLLKVTLQPCLANDAPLMNE